MAVLDQNQMIKRKMQIHQPRRKFPTVALPNYAFSGGINSLINHNQISTGTIPPRTAVLNAGNYQVTINDPQVGVIYKIASDEYGWDGSKFYPIKVGPQPPQYPPYQSFAIPPRGGFYSAGTTQNYTQILREEEEPKEEPKKKKKEHVHTVDDKGFCTGKKCKKFFSVEEHIELYRNKSGAQIEEEKDSYYSNPVGNISRKGRSTTIPFIPTPKQSQALNQFRNKIDRQALIDKMIADLQLSDSLADKLNSLEALQKAQAGVGALPGDDQLSPSKAIAARIAVGRAKRGLFK